MTEEERREEGAEEAIEDLEAPAAAQEDVAGGRGARAGCDTPVTLNCQDHTCVVSVTRCDKPQITFVVHNR